MADGARHHAAVDAAGRSADDDVDDPQVDLAPDFAQQIEIDRFGVVLGIVAIDQRIEGGICALGALGDAVQPARSAHELEYLLVDAVHVDGERDAAKAYQGEPKLLFLHHSTPETRRRAGHHARKVV